jgi:hypothetical protein
VRASCPTVAVSHGVTDMWQPFCEDVRDKHTELWEQRCRRKGPELEMMKRKIKGGKKRKMGEWKNEESEVKKNKNSKGKKWSNM